MSTKNSRSVRFRQCIMRRLKKSQPNKLVGVLDQDLIKNQESIFQVSQTSPKEQQKGYYPSTCFMQAFPMDAEMQLSDPTGMNHTRIIEQTKYSSDVLKGRTKRWSNSPDGYCLTLEARKTDTQNLRELQIRTKSMTQRTHKPSYRRISVLRQRLIVVTIDGEHAKLGIKMRLPKSSDTKKDVKSKEENNCLPFHPLDRPLFERPLLAIPLLKRKSSGISPWDSVSSPMKLFK